MQALRVVFFKKNTKILLLMSIILFLYYFKERSLNVSLSSNSTVT